jgi:hypothetical protein
MIGLRVKILPYANYRDKYKDEFGVIERGSPNHTSVGIRLDRHTNSASSYGLFWFDKNQFEIIKEKDEVFMLQNYKVAGISFLEGTNTNSIYYYALYDDTIQVDDVVVVNTGHHGLGIAKVVEIDPVNVDKNHVRCGREIISKVDFSAYNERQEKAKKIVKLKNEMDAKVQQLQNQAIYELMAEKDPELKKMLDEYKTLLG